MNSIKTHRDYRRFLKEIELLMTVSRDSAEGDKLDRLVADVEAWERRYHSIDPAAE
jgi:HTH-type transcriptional regulator/antitoxin HigA